MRVVSTTGYPVECSACSAYDSCQGMSFPRNGGRMGGMLDTVSYAITDSVVYVLKLFLVRVCEKCNTTLSFGR